jgi:pyruvate/2-oxoglutarate dehydrogenase complex dihydrolipoamide acyltransferase (E2) component
MSATYQYHPVPRSRIATFDVLSIGKLKHHVAALLEFDVTESRKKLREAKKSGSKVSFTAWLLKVIARSVELHPEVAAFLANKSKIITFNNVNISILVEKEVNHKKVPLPLVIEKADQKSPKEISLEIEKALKAVMTEKDIVLQKRSTRSENIYYNLPGFLRQMVWRIMLKNPRFAFSKMGNVSVTSLGMMGKINGWFVHSSVHPISFGVGSVIRKPIVVNDEIKIREILNMTILLDHDVIDGAPMVRFVNELTRMIEGGSEI